MSEDPQDRINVVANIYVVGEDGKETLAYVTSRNESRHYMHPLSVRDKAIEEFIKKGIRVELRMVFGNEEDLE